MARSNHTSTRRRRAALSLAITAACLVGAVATSSSAEAARTFPRSTTTKKPTTTTTVAPVTTTTKAPVTTTTVAPTTTAAPTTTTTTAPAPTCGATVLKADGSAWQCTLADEFGGTTLDSTKWIAQQTANSGYTSGGECYFDRTNNVSVGGGVLTLTARKEAAPFTCPSPGGDWTTQYTGGMVSTAYRFSQTYGRFEVRAKLPTATVKGLQTAFWLWPDNATKYGNWPASGEIDIAEYYTQYPDRVIPYIHYNDGGLDPNVTNNWCMVTDPTQFHSYVAEWTPTTISIIYDGQTCVVDTWNALGLAKPAPFDHPFMVVLTQALGINTNAFDPATTPLPASTQVDYVHVWK